jgi:hypothetical protein
MAQGTRFAAPDAKNQGRAVIFCSAPSAAMEDMVSGKPGNLT